MTNVTIKIQNRFYVDSQLWKPTFFWTHPVYLEKLKLVVQIEQYKISNTSEDATCDCGETSDILSKRITNGLKFGIISSCQNCSKMHAWNHDYIFWKKQPC